MRAKQGCSILLILAIIVGFTFDEAVALRVVAGPSIRRLRRTVFLGATRLSPLPESSMKRSFHLALARPPRSFPLKTMPILRLPTVLFPDQKMALPLTDSRSEALPSSSASYAAFGPGALVGVELSQLTAAPCQEQLLVGGSRVRLIRSRPSHDKTAIVGVLQRVVDVSMTPERAARLWKDQKANPPIRCNAPTSASNTAQ